MTAAVAEAASPGAHPTFADGSDAVSRYIGSITDWDREALAARDRVPQKSPDPGHERSYTAAPVGWPDDPPHRRSSRHRRHASGISPRRRRHGYRRRLGESRARVRRDARPRRRPGRSADARRGRTLVLATAPRVT